MSKSRAFSIVIAEPQSAVRNRAIAAAGLSVTQHVHVRPAQVHRNKKAELSRGRTKHRGRQLDY